MGEPRGHYAERDKVGPERQIPAGLIHTRSLKNVNFWKAGTGTAVTTEERGRWGQRGCWAKGMEFQAGRRKKSHILLCRRVATVNVLHLSEQLRDLECCHHKEMIHVWDSIH